MKQQTHDDQKQAELMQTGKCAADAKLIAAAPELLEALNAVRDQLDKCRRLLDTDYDINTALELANKVIGKVQS